MTEGAENVEKQEAGWEIDGEFYPVPSRYRIGDPVLIADLTGMDWAEFSSAMDNPEKHNDPTLVLALLGVAYWQKHPHMTRSKAVLYLQTLDIDAISAVGFEDAAVDERPPEVAVEESVGTSAEMNGASKESAAIASESILASSGLPGSATTTPE